MQVKFPILTPPSNGGKRRCCPADPPSSSKESLRFRSVVEVYWGVAWRGVSSASLHKARTVLSVNERDTGSDQRSIIPTRIVVLASILKVVMGRHIHTGTVYVLVTILVTIGLSPMYWFITSKRSSFLRIWITNAIQTVPQTVFLLAKWNEHVEMNARNFLLFITRWRGFDGNIKNYINNFTNNP